jgi:hypothetical protein
MNYLQVLWYVYLKLREICRCCLQPGRTLTDAKGGKIPNLLSGYTDINVIHNGTTVKVLR